MNHAYEFWLYDLKRRLIHEDALLCTAPPPEQALQTFFSVGFSARRIALVLNRRWENGFLERKREREARKP